MLVSEYIKAKKHELLFMKSQKKEIDQFLVYIDIEASYHGNGLQQETDLQNCNNLDAASEYNELLSSWSFEPRTILILSGYFHLDKSTYIQKVPN